MTTCPFCNAELTGETARQAACPRCGEVVPSAGNHAVTHRAETPSSDERPPNSRIALLVIGVMFAMATLGLVFALNTVEHRRSIDTRGQEKEVPPIAATFVKPTDLAGLGYIPADSHILLGLHVAQLRSHPAGEALLRRLRTADDLSLARLTDHLLVGLNLKAVPPRVTFVAHSASDGDSSRLEAGYPVGRPAKNGDRILSKHSDSRRGFDVWLGRADSRTLVACQLHSDFDAVPQAAQPGTERLTHLRSLINDRLDSRASAWLVGQIEPENSTLPVLAALTRIPELEKLRAVSLAFREDGGDLSAALDIQGRDSVATAALVDWIGRSLGAAGVVAERTKDGDWQRLTAKLTAESIAKWTK